MLTYVALVLERVIDSMGQTTEFLKVTSIVLVSNYVKSLISFCENVCSGYYF